MDLLLEHIDNVILAVKHICQITRKTCEAVMGRLHGLALVHSHATLLALMRALTLTLLVLNDIQSLNHASAINARHCDIGAYSLVLRNLLPDALCLALFVSLALDRLEFALLVVCRNISVGDHLGATHHVVTAFKLHLGQLLFDVFLDAQEFWIFALHGTHARRRVELLEAFVVEAIAAALALNRVNENSLTKAAKELRLELVSRQ